VLLRGDLKKFVLWNFFSVFVMPRYRGGRSSPENQPAASVLIGSTTTETLLLR
jgi:hypothetical protein